MNKLAERVSSIVGAHGLRRRLVVGMIFTGNRELAEGVLMRGQKTLVLSDRFFPLFRLHGSIQKNGGGESSARVLFAETRLDSLPLAPGSLDMLVLTSGLPGVVGMEEALVALRGLLKPDGWLVWTERASKGANRAKSASSSPGSKKSRRRAVAPSELCLAAMAAGFKEVGQTLVKKTFGQWVVTTGRRGKRPWESPVVAGNL